MLLSAFQRETGSQVVEVGFSKWHASSAQNGLVIYMNARGMLED